MKPFIVYILSVFLLLPLQVCFSQQGQWTWMHGDNIPDQLAVYGIKGVANSSNKPGALYEACEWTDTLGNFWLFGGRTTNSSTYNNTYYNSLWRYNPVTNEWSWMSGDSFSNSSGTYGTQGTPSPTNVPGARSGAISWTDNNGSLWLFGGYGYDVNGNKGTLNDLWKYNPTINEWVWMKGSNTASPMGVYGTKGVSAAANNPQPRNGSCAWKDDAGNLWLFGGIKSGSLNDLWKYDLTTNEWTWISGDNTPGQNSIYGIQGISNPANKPGSRISCSSWKDQNNNLWLFGGFQKTIISTGASAGCSNDLWKYNITSNEWTWMSGSNIPDQSGIYGTKCLEAGLNIPGARAGATAEWTDACGNFWLFGGSYFSLLNNNYNSYDFNDLWRYNPVTNNWTWISGDNISNQAGIYGTIGIPSTNNKPAAANGTVGWSTNIGLFLWGGGVSKHTSTSNLLHINSLWKYTFDTIRLSYTSAPCAPLTQNFSALIGCGTAKSFLWDFGDPLSGINNTSSSANPIHQFTAPGTYSVTLNVTNCLGELRSITQQISITSQKIANAGDDIYLCSGLGITINATGGGSYQWSPLIGLNNSNIPNPFVNPVTTTTYVLTIYNGSCIDKDTLIANVYSLPSVNAGTDITIDMGSNTQLTTTGNGISYSWTPTDGLSCINCPNPIANPVKKTTYYLTITDGNGCTNIDAITIDVVCDLFIPNAFSPNEDRNNNILYVLSRCIKGFQFTIYDRWGHIVFETNDIGQGWDGTYKGDKMNTGIFLYQFKAILPDGNSFEKAGNISLIR